MKLFESGNCFLRGVKVLKREMEFLMLKQNSD
jgi:hypothetical protein